MVDMAATPEKKMLPSIILSRYKINQPLGTWCVSEEAEKCSIHYKSHFPHFFLEAKEKKIG